MSHVSSAINHKKLKIAFIGNPNSGKTTLFNVLTGLRQKVANYPGVTVDKKTGSFKHIEENIHWEVEIIDLPGTYSIHPRSDDERVAVEVLSNPNNPDYPDVVVVIADASSLKRSLLFCSQIIDLNRPTVLALNMIDVAKQKGITINFEALSKELGVIVVPINSRKAEGIELLKQCIVKASSPKETFFPDEDTSITPNQDVIRRYHKITAILSHCVTNDAPTSPFIEKLDKWVTHKVGGYVIFLGLLFLIFQSIFSWATYPMELIDQSFSFAGQWLANVLPDNLITQLLVDGILPGLSGIFIFIPQIAILFTFIVFLEDSGYMARVSFIMDKIFRKFGLNGKSVIPLLSGSACAVPAIMSTRAISNWKERIITIMVTPLMSCSARLPVYTLLIALVIPNKQVLGVLNLQGLALMALYLIGFIAAMGTAFVMKFLIKTKGKSYFIMEIPAYKLPRLSTIGLTIVEKVKIFIVDAGKIIVAISVVLWVLSSYGPSEKMEQIERKYQTEEMKQRFDDNTIAKKVASEKLQASYAGIFGKTIEPVIAPLGFDWKIGIALITSFAAREAFVGTMATIYSVGDSNDESTIREKMQNETNPYTGEKLYSTAFGFSLLIFYCFAMQCMSTLAVVYRETKHWKWPLFQLFYMTGLAYISSFVVYQILK